MRQTVFVKLLAEPKVFDTPGTSGPAVWVAATEIGYGGSVLEAVNALSSKYRTAIYLYYYEGTGKGRPVLS